MDMIITARPGTSGTNRMKERGAHSFHKELPVTTVDSFAGPDSVYRTRAYTMDTGGGTAGGPDHNKATERMLTAAGVDGANYDWVKVLELVEIAGADVNAAGDRGVTALMQAAIAGEVYMTRFLLEHGAKIDIVDALGGDDIPWTASDYARLWASRGGAKHQEIVDILDEAMQKKTAESSV